MPIQRDFSSYFTAVQNTAEVRDNKKKQYYSKIELRKNRKGEVKIGENSVHFCIAVGRMYRVEYDTNTRKARCNFNDKNAVSKYQTVFNQLFEASTPTYL